MRLVLDASVVLKWYVPENESLKAQNLQRWIHEHGRQVFVPQFFYLETTSILWKKQVLRKELSAELAQAIRQSIHQLSFHVLEDRSLLTQAAGLAEKYHVTPYDGLYVAAAIEEGCSFITADQKLVNKLKAHPHAEAFISLADWKANL
jgi:predicted nucleic acid-binding protein